MEQILKDLKDAHVAAGGKVELSFEYLADGKVRLGMTVYKRPGFWSGIRQTCKRLSSVLKSTGPALEEIRQVIPNCYENSVVRITSAYADLYGLAKEDLSARHRMTLSLANPRHFNFGAYLETLDD